ncbi:hypothetical protein BV898_18993 [Hypsibius exemplaris]|uniref:Uncharacterized protein n=1 Tax=Hypsibius exemplaris TaxID=2072580 RepID=A0A9X6NKX2_HYPEX|nr:hypothetical protein BV898_18993 [Hypsibius exemplaris]
MFPSGATNGRGLIISGAMTLSCRSPVGSLKLKFRSLTQCCCEGNPAGLRPVWTMVMLSPTGTGDARFLASAGVWVSASPPSPTYSVADAFLQSPEPPHLLLECRIPPGPPVPPSSCSRSATVCACRLLKAMSISTSVTDGCGNSGE